MADSNLPDPGPAEAAADAITQVSLNTSLLFALLSISVPVLGLVFAGLRLHRQRILALEHNLDIQQRLNELALANDKNLKAAFCSVRDDGEYDEDGAREVFFHYLRLNRIYRAWVLWQNWVLRSEDFLQIIDSYAGTLKKAAPMFDSLRHRGYPPAFIAELTRAVDKAEAPPLIDLKQIGQSYRKNG